MDKGRLKHEKTRNKILMKKMQEKTNRPAQ